MPVILSIVVLILAGCSVAPNREMPKNSGAGTDEMKLSPCACIEFDYDSRGFEWTS